MGVGRVRVGGLRRDRGAVPRRGLAHRITQRLDLGPRPEHEDRARPLTGADQHVRGAGGAVEVVPLLERPLLVLDDQQALAREHEEALLRVLGVIERVRVTGPEDADPDADVRERMVARLERIRRASLLLVPHRERVGEVEDEPAVRPDVTAVRCLVRACFPDGHAFLLRWSSRAYNARCYVFSDAHCEGESDEPEEVQRRQEVRRIFGRGEGRDEGARPRAEGRGPESRRRGNTARKGRRDEGIGSRDGREAPRDRQEERPGADAQDLVRDAGLREGGQGPLLLPERRQVRLALRVVRLHGRGEPRRRRDVADLLRSEGADPRRREAHRRAREEGGELRAGRSAFQTLSVYR